MSSARRAAMRVQRRAGVEFEVRDIRRTVASGMTEIEIDPEIVDRVLNHAIPSESRVTKTYQTSLLWAKLREKREALERWADHLDQVILKRHGKEIVRRAITTPRTYEGWNRWASVGRGQRRQETWAERRARLAADGRDLNEEHRQRQVAARTAAAFGKQPELSVSMKTIGLTPTRRRAGRVRARLVEGEAEPLRLTPHA